MKIKLLKKLRKEAKENVYLTHYYSEEGMLCIIYKILDQPFGLTTTFYNKGMDMFCKDTIINYKTIEEALPDLQKARRCYILSVLHSEYRACSKGQEKRNKMERLKQEDYQKYLKQF